LFPKDLARFWEIAAIHKKTHIKRHPPKLVSLFPLAESFPPLALRPPLLAADRVGVDVHGDVAVGFAESHAAAIKHTVIRVEKTMGVVKAYLQLKAATATKQMASAPAMLRTRAKVSAGSPPSSHANTAANKRNTEKKSPNALKKSQ
jgi:hypothetical protein